MNHYREINEGGQPERFASYAMLVISLVALGVTVLVIVLGHPGASVLLPIFALWVTRAIRDVLATIGR